MKLFLILSYLISLNIYAQNKVCIEPFHGEMFKAGKQFESNRFLVLPKKLKELHEEFKNKYPEYATRYDKMDRQEIMLSPQVSKSEEIPLSESTSYRPLNDMQLIARFHSLDKLKQEAITKAYNSLNDSEKLKNYIKNLYTESFYHATLNPKRYNRVLESGVLSEENIGLTLIKRFKRRKVMKFTRIIKANNEGFYINTKKDIVREDIAKNSNASFRYAIRTGPFIDNAFSNSWDGGHGAYTHMLQRDFLYSELKNIYGEDVSPFYEYLGSKKGISFWADLFDSGSSRSFTSPETANSEVGRILGLY